MQTGDLLWRPSDWEQPKEGAKKTEDYEFILLFKFKTDVSHLLKSVMNDEAKHFKSMSNSFRILWNLTLTTFNYKPKNPLGWWMGAYGIGIEQVQF